VTPGEYRRQFVRVLGRGISRKPLGIRRLVKRYEAWIDTREVCHATSLLRQSRLLQPSRVPLKLSDVPDVEEPFADEARRAGTSDQTTNSRKPFAR
jgi:hypothetical protein